MAQQITLNVEKVTLIEGDTSDTLYLHLDAPSSYPRMGYTTSVKVETQKGYAREWASKMGIEVTNTIQM